MSVCQNTVNSILPVWILIKLIREYLKVKYKLRFSISETELLQRLKIKSKAKIKLEVNKTVIFKIFYYQNELLSTLYL